MRRGVRPLASLSLDLDNQWSYMKTHGDVGWESFPSYLNLVVPRFLEVFARLSLPSTVFVVGQDAAIAANGDALRAIAAAGCEIGNHSFRHEPWLHLYSETELEQDISDAETAIEGATGRRPVGFRGPGFSLSDAVLHILARRGYEYDASTFPTFLGPLARAYYFMNARLAGAARDQRAALFGRFADGFQPLKPYLWRTPDHELVEIPVTTLPIARLPIHVSYVLYLATYSTSAAFRYFDVALRLCRLTNTEPSLLLHPLDFLGRDDLSSLAFFPAMNMSGAAKLIVVERCLERFSSEFEVVSMLDHARRVRARADVLKLDPSSRRHLAPKSV